MKQTMEKWCFLDDSLFQEWKDRDMSVRRETGYEWFKLSENMKDWFNVHCEIND